MSRRKLPIGLHTLREIREQDCYYVDKTAQIQRLINEGSYYFLARPRGFGKSLLVDTLRELFEGNEALFRGLAIHDEWDWSFKRPVVHLSFDGSYEGPDDIDDDLDTQLASIEDKTRIKTSPEGARGVYRLMWLLFKLHRESGQRVVVLIDNFDKPVLDVIDKPKMAKNNLDHLMGLNGIIKGRAEDVSFVFSSGVTKLGSGTLSTGIDNLLNISLYPRFASICGFTESDLDAVFAPELEGLDRDQMRKWYQGYSWLGEEMLYNPLSVLKLFKTREFKPHWGNSDMAALVCKMMIDSGSSLLDFEQKTAGYSDVNNIWVDRVNMTTLLLQTGYLNAIERQQEETRSEYTLDYSNYEVRQELNRAFLEYLLGSDNKIVAQGRDLSRMLAANDFKGLLNQLRSILAKIPYQSKSSHQENRFERWCAGILYSCFSRMELDARAKDLTSWQRTEVELHHKGQIFGFDFKLVSKPT